MKKLILILCLISFPVLAETEHLTILHFNDLHGHVENAAKIATLIKQVQKNNARRGWFTLVLNGGDIISGTPVSERFGGRAEIDFLNKIKTDAAVVGNHDFDFGLQTLISNMSHSKFTTLTANVYYKDTGHVFAAPFVILIPAPLLKVGIFGLTHELTPSLTNPKNVEALKFDKALPVAQKMMVGLVKKSNLQIALTHEGVAKDMELAEKVKGIDLIIGGHDHVKPEEYCREVKKIPVCQTPAYGKYVGRIDLEVETNDNNSGLVVKELGHSLIPIDSYIRDDKEVAELVERYIKPVKVEMEEVIGFANSDIRHGRGELATPLGLLIANVIKDSVSADFGVINAGGIRMGLRRGKITRGDIEEIVPFRNEVVKVEMTGLQIGELLSESRTKTGPLQLAGLNYDTTLDPKKKYTIATIDFLVNGGDGYKAFKNAQLVSNSGRYVKDVLIDYIKRRKEL